MIALPTDGQTDGLTNGFNKIDKRISGVIVGAVHLDDQSNRLYFVVVLIPDGSLTGLPKDGQYNLFTEYPIK